MFCKIVQRYSKGVKLTGYSHNAHFVSKIHDQCFHMMTIDSGLFYLIPKVGSKPACIFATVAIRLFILLRDLWRKARKFLFRDESLDVVFLT